MHHHRLLTHLRRRWLLVLILTGFAALVAVRQQEVVRVLSTLGRGRWPWILAAALLQGAFYLVYAAEYRLGLASVGVESRVRDLVPVLFASLFLKAIVPSGGVSALAVVVDDAARRGQSAVRAAQGALLVLVADLTAILPLVAYGLHHLAYRQALEPYQIVASTILLLFTGSLAGMILLGRWLPGRLHALFRALQHIVNGLAGQLGRPVPLAETWAEQQADDYVRAAKGLSEAPRLLGSTLGVAMAACLVNLASLYALSLAYGWPLRPGTLIAGYMLNIVFSIVTIIPHGIGVAEGAMALVLASLGVTTTSAVAITVAFRGLNVWLPLAIGFFFLRRVRSLGGGETP